MVALAVNPRNGELYGLQHGRDQLFEHWPEFYTVEDDAVLPSEEFVHLARGSDNGWPYCYHDGVNHHRKVLAPEYGGDGDRVSGGPGINCATYTARRLRRALGAERPALLQRLDVSCAVSRRRLHRVPRRLRPRAASERGYQVVFVPVGRNGLPCGDPETFADGFAGSAGPLPATAVHRPVGVTEGPDGSLYVSDDRGGRIWRIIFRG